VTTGAWIEPEVDRRVALVSQCPAPDYATVNLSEDGSVEVTRALLDAGVDIEAGVWTVKDAEMLVASGVSDRVLRVYIEPVEVSRADVVSLVTAIHQALDLGAVTAARLQHGDGEATWILIEDAISGGIATRVGWKTRCSCPMDQPAISNADLVRAAYDIGARDHACCPGSLTVSVHPCRAADLAVAVAYRDRWGHPAGHDSSIGGSITGHQAWAGPPHRRAERRRHRARSAPRRCAVIGDLEAEAR
jgi:hypothetical protein